MCKIALLWKKVCYKVSLHEYRQRKSFKAFTGLFISAKMVGGGRPVESEFSSKCEPPVSAKANASRADKEGNATHILFASQ